MKLPVTGATGGIGSWTVDRLASAGHDVVDLETVDRSGNVWSYVDVRDVTSL